MTEKLGASAQIASICVSMHYIAVGASNFKMSADVDKYSYSSIVGWRTPALAVLALGEAMAPNMLWFGLVYVLAGVTIVGPSPPYTFYMKALPKSNSKLMNMYFQFGFQCVAVAGMGVGGVVAGLVSFRLVFLVSSLWAAAAATYEYVFLLGSDAKLFDDQRALAVEMESHGIRPSDLHADVDEVFPLLLSNAMKQKQMSTRKALKQICVDCISVPMILAAVIATTSSYITTEFLSWWNVYMHARFGTNLALTNMQIACGLVARMIVTTLSNVLVHRYLKSSIYVGAMLFCHFAAMTVLLVVFFPAIDDPASGWLLMILFGAFYGAAGSLDGIIMVEETIPEICGTFNGMRMVCAFSVVATSHLIVGSVWNTGTDHVGYFYYFAVIFSFATVAAFSYVVLKAKRQIFAFEFIEYFGP
jgi:hypothetical protein